EGERWTKRPDVLFPSDRDQLAMLPECHAQPVAYLSQRRVGLDCVDDQREEVLGPGGGLRETVERSFPGVGIAGRAQPSHAVDLSTLGGRIYPLQIGRVNLVVAELVDSDDDPLAFLH